MLFEFLTSLIDQYSFLNVFKYLTFRTGLSLMTSLIIVFLIGGPLIKFFSKMDITGPIRQDGPIDHIVKKTGTPTMGGIIIIIGILTSTLMWADLKNIYNPNSNQQAQSQGVRQHNNWVQNLNWSDNDVGTIWLAPKSNSEIHVKTSSNMNFRITFWSKPYSSNVII